MWIEINTHASKQGLTGFNPNASHSHSLGVEQGH
jgi:hypothetical protein